MPLSGDINNYIQQYYNKTFKVMGLLYTLDSTIMCRATKKTKRNFLIQ